MEKLNFITSQSNKFINMKEVKKRKYFFDFLSLPNEIISTITSFLDSSSILKFSISSKSLQWIPSDNTNIKEHLNKLKNSFFLNKIKLTDTYIHECQTIGWLIHNYGIFFNEKSKLKVDEDSHRNFFLDHNENLNSISKEVSTLHLYQPTISEIFNPENFELFSGYFNTHEFQTFSRLFSYHLFEIAKTIPVYENLYLFKKRKLNYLEEKLFETHGKYSPKELVSEDQFLKNFNSFFHVNDWRDFIDWEKFFLVGGSVLKCILKDTFDGESSDIDLFFIGDCYYKFKDSFMSTFEKAKDLLDPEHYLGQDIEEIIENDDIWALEGTSEYILNLFLIINEKKLKFQFIWYDSSQSSTSMNPERILNIFDIDCCQIGYDGEKVRCSYPFIQSVNTGTFINYKFVNSQENVSNFFPRTMKYMDRGFTLIHSHHFDKKLLKSLDKRNVREEDKTIRDTYSGFLINNDSMEVCKNFIELLK
jgi:hypothetical protein